MRQRMAAWWNAQSPAMRGLFRALGPAALGVGVASGFVLGVSSLTAVLGLAIGAYVALALRDLGEAVLDSLTPSTRSERRRARRMARAAGVELDEGAA